MVLHTNARHMETVALTNKEKFAMKSVLMNYYHHTESMKLKIASISAMLIKTIAPNVKLKIAQKYAISMRNGTYKMDKTVLKEVMTVMEQANSNAIKNQSILKRKSKLTQLPF